MERVEETKQSASRDGRRNTVKRRHTLDPDKPSGARELLVLNLAAENRVQSMQLEIQNEHIEQLEEETVEA